MYVCMYVCMYACVGLQTCMFATCYATHTQTHIHAQMNSVTCYSHLFDTHAYGTTVSASVIEEDPPFLLSYGNCSLGTLVLVPLRIASDTAVSPAMVCALHCTSVC